MNRVFLLLAVLFLFVSVVGFAEKSGNNNPQKIDGWSFSVGPIFGARVGKENEIVWRQNTQTGKTYKLSELEWIYTPSLYLGDEITIGYKRFEFSLVSKVFFPMGCGIMKDSDWVQDAYYYTGNTSTKTNYSESKNRVVIGGDLELAFSAKIYPTSFLTLRPRISVSYSYMEFSAIGGTYWYGLPLENSKNTGSYYSYDSDKIKTASLGDTEVLHYKANSVYLWLGLKADFIPAKKVILSIATEAAPLVYMVSFDSHVRTNYKYKQDSLSLFYAVRQSFSALLKINDLVSISLWLQGILTGETLGPTYYKRIGSSSEYIRNGNAGSSSMYLDTGVSLKFNW